MSQYNPYILIPLLLVFVLLVSCNSDKPHYKKLADGTPESCITCHDNIQGFSRHHNPNDIGCSACHLGNIESYNKDIAHEKMYKIPGNLANAKQTCATANCHFNELDRINTSLMSTNSGIVSIDKWVFGELQSTDTLCHIENITDTAGDRHLKNLCFTCHLGYEKKYYGAIGEQSRGGGCLACHLNYKNNTTANIKDNIHPSLNLNIGNEKCFGCHSRSGRISTNYKGWFETLLTKDQLKEKDQYHILKDGRVFGKAQEDLHHKAGLLCIDCHISQEIMGDGKSYKHEREAIKIQCIDCHTQQHKTIDREKLGTIAALDYALRNYNYSTEKFIITAIDTIPLVNSFFDKNNTPFLIGKITQEKHPITASCKKDNVHQNLDCSMCHTSWAPSCIGCHTSFDENIELNNGEKGKWYEMVGEFGKSKPIMGVRQKNQEKLITPAIPGMIMTLDKSHFKGPKSGKDESFFRLFAPIAAHTTTKEVRSCTSCHNNSEALGYGKGELIYSVINGIGKWEFHPLFESITFDSLPQDAWIGFLSEKDKSRNYSAHEDFFPLSIEQQKKVLEVGACLYCHKGDKELEDKLLFDTFKNLKKIRNQECILPK